MSRVEDVFQEYQDRQCGLTKALNSNLCTLIEECRKIGDDTPYVQRKCLWGLKDKHWKLQYAEYANFGAPPQPQPLPPFEEGMSLRQWVTIVMDYSHAWLVSFLGYLSSSFTMEERMELLKKIEDLPSMEDVVNVEYECVGANPQDDRVTIDVEESARKPLSKEGETSLPNVHDGTVKRT